MKYKYNSLPIFHTYTKKWDLFWIPKSGIWNPENKKRTKSTFYPEDSPLECICWLLEILSLCFEDYFKDCKGQGKKF